MDVSECYFVHQKAHKKWPGLEHTRLCRDMSSDVRLGTINVQCNRLVIYIQGKWIQSDCYDGNYVQKLLNVQSTIVP